MEIEDILSDPDFHSLRDFERLKVLYSLDPDYRALHPRERWKTVTTELTNYLKSSMAPLPPPLYNTGENDENQGG